MSDNTTLNIGTGGDSIRALARTTGVSAGSKTQAFALDIGGAATNAEKLLAAGQAIMANSLPVVIASDQVVPVSGAVTANIAGSIGNTAFGISGTLPPFAATPTVNVGTMPSVTISGTAAVSLAALPALAIGSNVIGGVTLSGTLPAFAAPPTVKLSDTAGTGITSTTIAGKQRLDVTLAAGGVPGVAASTIADQVGGVDSGGLLRAFSVDATGRMNVQGGNATAVKTDGSTVTQPVSATALPLPAGAATSALQTTINATLGTPFQAGGSVGITGTPAFKVSDTAGAGITSTLLAGKQRLDVTLAAGGAPGATASTIADQVGGVDGGGLLRAFSVDATGRMNVQGGNVTAVKTDGSAVTQPVSGTVAVTGAYQATQPVSGTVAVTGAYQATQPVSATALPLPTGAATSALQTTINTTLGTPFQAGGSVGITGTLPAFAAPPTVKLSDTAGAGITSTLVAGKQRLDVTLAAGGAPGATASIVADQVGGVDGGGLLRALSVDTGGRVNVQGGNATAVKTDGSAVTQPVSGTVAVTGAYQTTQPVSIATMPTTAVTGALTGYVSARVIQQTPTVTAATAYATGQVIGGLLTFANAGRAAGGNGTLQDAVVLFADSQTQPMDLIILSASPTGITDKAPFALAAADVTKVLRVIHLSDISTLGTPSIAELHGLATKYVADGSGNLYGVLVARGTPTFGTATGVTIQIGVEANA